MAFVRRLGQFRIESLLRNTFMSRIFPSLAVVAVILMGIAFWLGWAIEDAASMEPDKAAQVRWHFFMGLGAMVFTSLVHSIILTYFVGTGRWLEETSKAYGLPETYFAESKKIKYRTIPLMVIGIVAIVFTGAMGAIADPAARSSFAGWFGLTPAKTHFAIACMAVMGNLLVHFIEFQAVVRNGRIVNAVLADVHRIRKERGLPTEPMVPISV